MTDYISRKTAMSMPMANGKYDHEHANEHFIYGLETYKEWLEELPAADVRPVVYCRDCMYAPAGDDDGNCLEWPCDDWPDRNPCPLKCGDNWYSKKPEPDFFCKNGKRKRNG